MPCSHAPFSLRNSSTQCPRQCHVLMLRSHWETLRHNAPGNAMFSCSVLIEKHFDTMPKAMPCSHAPFSLRNTLTQCPQAMPCSHAPFSLRKTLTQCPRQCHVLMLRSHWETLLHNAPGSAMFSCSVLIEKHFYTMPQAMPCSHAQLSLRNTSTQCHRQCHVLMLRSHWETLRHIAPGNAMFSSSVLTEKHFYTMPQAMPCSHAQLSLRNTSTQCPMQCHVLMLRSHWETLRHIAPGNAMFSSSVLTEKHFYTLPQAMPRSHAPFSLRNTSTQCPRQCHVLMLCSHWETLLHNAPGNAMFSCSVLIEKHFDTIPQAMSCSHAPFSLRNTSTQCPRQCHVLMLHSHWETLLHNAPGNVMFSADHYWVDDLKHGMSIWLIRALTSRVDGQDSGDKTNWPLELGVGLSDLINWTQTTSKTLPN